MDDIVDIDHLWNISFGKTSDSMPPETAQSARYIFLTAVIQTLGLVLIEMPEQVKAGKYTAQEVANKLKHLMEQALDEWKEMTPEYEEWEQKRKVEKN